MLHESSGRLWRFQKLLATSGFACVLEGSKNGRDEARGRPNENNIFVLHESYTARDKQPEKPSENGVAPKAAPPPRYPLPTPGLPHEPLGESSLEPRTSARLVPGPDAHALALLASVNRAAGELPSLVPEAEECDAMARVVLAGGPEDPSEAWEHLDRELNRLLGYGIGIEEIAQRVRRGPLGVKGLTRYINGFVVDYSITGALLEGKLERLSKAIELVIQSVLI
jgi:hypothetical protein